MVDAEKIIAEIRRLKTELQGYSAREVLDYIESYINLQEQSSLPSDLDEAANKFGFKETHERLMEGEITRKNERMFRWQIEKAFKAAAKWQEEKDQEIIKLAEDHAFLAGADWQKEQMMKEAVEADVNIYRDIAAGKSWAEFVVEMPTNNLDDKVKVIIIKKEESK